MPKKKITLDRHREIGKYLRELNDSFHDLGKEIQAAYPKNSPEVGYLSGKTGLIQTLFKLRADLENAAIAAGGDTDVYFV